VRGTKDGGRGDHWPWAGRAALAEGGGMRAATPAAARGWKPWIGIVPQATSFRRFLTVTEAIRPTGTVHTVDRSRAGLRGLAACPFRPSES